MDKKLFLIIISIFLLSYKVLSQSVLGVQYPFGIPLSRSSGYSLAMGGCGTAINNDLMGLSGNPANLGISGRTAFSSVFGSDIYFVNDNTSASQHVDMNLRLFSITIPFGRFGSLGFSFEPSSSSNL
ncbi:MAG: hypothetical protein N2053_10735, partial [Chitinispirillaceae bacterium]|nr:hypothetical protein [Chitinispirillaceae bacterium]